MLERVTVHAYCKGAIQGGSAFIHVAGMVLQAITNVRVTTHKSKTGEAAWGLIKGKQTVSMTADLKGENMYHFLTKLVSVVMPKIKDWKGLRATTGDSSGNLSLGLTPDVVSSFPEVEVNYDS
jgi:large subunit ribosomal protein L5